MEYIRVVDVDAEDVRLDATVVDANDVSDLVDGSFRSHRPRLRRLPGVVRAEKRMIVSLPLLCELSFV